MSGENSTFGNNCMGLVCKTKLLFHFYNALHSTTEPLSEPYTTYHKIIIQTFYRNWNIPYMSWYFIPFVPNQWFKFINMMLNAIQKNSLILWKISYIVCARIFFEPLPNDTFLSQETNSIFSLNLLRTHNIGIVQGTVSQEILSA